MRSNIDEYHDTLNWVIEIHYIISNNFEYWRDTEE